MSPEAQRIAIAKACGWHRIELPEARLWAPAGVRSIEAINYIMPDYPHDLNAMHEAEKVLTLGRRIEYVRDLGFIFTGRNDRAIPEWWFVHEATAAQRAEAFLRTLNLWDDSK